MLLDFNIIKLGTKEHHNQWNIFQELKRKPIVKNVKEERKIK